MSGYEYRTQQKEQTVNEYIRGRASKERPWMKYYPEAMKDMPVPDYSVNDFLKFNIQENQNPAIHYYGHNLMWSEIWEAVETAAQALYQIGIREGDYIPVFLQAVPEFLILLLAAERVGAALVCRDDEPEACATAIRNANAKILFAHDYISEEEEKLYMEETPLERIITVSPYNMADRSFIPEHVEKCIRKRYQGSSACSKNNLTWSHFMALGEGKRVRETVIPETSRPLLCAYTSGSTGEPKQVIHSAQSIVGILYQMTPFAPPTDHHLTWLHTILPPALVAVVVSMILNPLATGKLLILDPFCEVEDLDLEMMRYQPNCWALIPMFMESLMKSKRIPEDYSMGYLYAAGAGAEALNNKQIHRVQQFLKQHDCNAFFSEGYGQSEAGSSCTMPCQEESIDDCCYGIPMPATILSIFEEGTHRELPYGEIGEICKCGPGNMLGYAGVEETKEVLQKHDDGKVWLHTGDFGYMTENGLIHVMGRGCKRRAGGGILFELKMENRVCEVEGLKDVFFVVVPDEENRGCFLPYAYVVLEEDARLEDVEKQMEERLEDYEKPCGIMVLEERPYFHFKTNRKGLAAEIMQKC